MKLSALAPLLLSLLGLTASLRQASAGDVQVESVVVHLIAEVEVASQEAGPLVELAVREGDRVMSGALLGRLDDRDVALEVERAEIALRHAREQAKSNVKLRQAKEGLELARLELQRATSANQELARVVSDSQLSKLQLDVRRAELDVEQADEDVAAAGRAVDAAQNELAMAERARERRRIVAPMEGIVVDVRRRAGEWLEPGAAVVRLVRDDRLRATGFVKLEQLTAPLAAQPARLLVPGTDGQKAEFLGRVTFISPEANPINRQVKVIAEFDNREGRLRAGLPAQMTIETDRAAAVP